jgi:hypothetical protein
LSGISSRSHCLLAWERDHSTTHQPEEKWHPDPPAEVEEEESAGLLPRRISGTGIGEIVTDIKKIRN